MVDVSVIIPIYNGQEFVAPLIKALQQQTHANVEFLIVDDGSTDGTTALLQTNMHTLADDARFHFLFKTNGGVSSARNFALSKVHGEYIIFIDADDMPDPEMIAAYYQQIKATNNDFEFFEVDKVDMAGNQVGRFAYQFDLFNRVVKRNEIFELLGYHFLFGYPFLYISKATLWQDICFDETIKYQEDLMVLADILGRNATIKAGFNPTSYYQYLQNPTSALHTMPLAGYIDFVTVANYVSDQAKQGQVPEKTVQIVNGLKISALVAVLAMAAMANDKATFEHFRKIYLQVYPDTLFADNKVKLRKMVQYFAIKYRIKVVLTTAYKKIFNV